MLTGKLAEAIILQAIGDLYEKDEYMSSVEFFTGEGFPECARMAGMDRSAMIGILEVVNKVVGPVSTGMRALASGGALPDRFDRIKGLHGTH